MVRVPSWRTSSRGWRFPAAVVLLWAVTCDHALPLTAMQNGTSAQSSADDDSRQLPTNGRVNLTLKALRAAIRHGHESKVLTNFRQLTTADRAVLVRRAGHQTYVPLHEVLAEEFERLSEESQAVLRTTSVRAARVALNDALKSRRWDELLNILHRFPGTESAHVARTLLAQLHLDHGNLQAAGFWLYTLRSSSLSPAAKRIVRQLQSRLPGKPAGRADAPSNPGRSNAATSAAWKVRWRHRPRLSAVLLDDIETAQLQAGVNTDAAWNARIKGSTIYRRTLRGLAAIDVHDGEVSWALKLRPSHLDQPNRNTHRSSGRRSTNSGLRDQFHRLLIHDGVRNRITNGVDAIYVLTASAGSAEFVATRLGQSAPKPDARLVAVSSLDGRRIWTVGGPGLEDGTGRELANVWFAGPPLVDRDVLHSVVQFENEIRLVALRARNGEVLQSTVLAFADDLIQHDPARQMVEATPVAADGLLLCSTTTGWLVAVDSLTHSVVWATRIGSTDPETALRTTRSSRRNRFSPEQSPATVIRVLGQTVAVISWNSRMIHFVDLHSGIRRRPFRLESRPGFLAAVDEGLVIVRNNGSIERVDALKSERVWLRTLTPEDGQPCGEGTVAGNQLLLAMTTGAIVTIDLSTGRFLESTPNVLRPSRRGMLLGLSPGFTASPAGQLGDLLFVGPADTICLTRDSVTVTPAETTEMVEHLLAEGHSRRAWKTLTQLPVSAFTTDARNAELRFEVALQLATEGRLPADVSLQELAVGRKQIVQAAVLQTAQEFGNDSTAAAITAFELLQSERESGPASTTAAIKLPSSLLPNASESGDKVSDVPQLSSHVSLKTWAAKVIEHALIQAPEDTRDRLVQQLDDLTPETLLQIDHPLVIGAINNRLREPARPELAVHLRLHRDAVLNDAAENPSDELPGRIDVSDIRSPESRGGSRRLFLEVLLAVAESPHSGDQAPDSVTAVALYDRQRQDWWNSWTHNDYLTIPVGRPTPSHRQPYRLRLAAPNDPFLRHFDWLIHRTPSRLLVREAAPSNRLLWSVPGFFPAQPGATGIPTLHRSGHLLLIQTSDAVTSVSLTENRVLWQIRAGSDIKDASGVSMRYLGPQLISNGPRWVCLWHRNLVEMRDALTGQCMWSCPAEFSAKVYVNDCCLIVSEDVTGTVTAFDRSSGQRMKHQFTFEDASHIVTAAGTQFVIRKPDAAEPGTVQYVWRNVLTGDDSQNLEVTDVAHIQQVGSSRLAVFHTDGRLSLIDLSTAEVRSYRWLKAMNSDSNGTENSTRPHPNTQWNPQRIRFFEDSTFIYLIHQTGASGPRIRIPERELTPFRALRVIDRGTGVHLWETSLPKSRTGVVVTDQLNLPFVAVLDEAVRGEQGGRKKDARVRLRCFHKRDGSLLIEQHLPSRYSYDELRITAAADYSVSARIHGTEVRFERPDARSVHAPTDHPVRPDTDAAEPSDE